MFFFTVRGEKRAMKYAIPRNWSVLRDYSTKGYSCIVDPYKRRASKNVPPVNYPDFSSSIAPVPLSADLPVPTPPKKLTYPQKITIQRMRTSSRI